MAITLERLGIGSFGYAPHQVFGEYSYGGTRYVVIHEVSVSGAISVYKRDPIAGTWSIQDEAGAPYFGGSVTMNATEFGVARSGDKLWVLFGLYTLGYPPDVLAEMAVWSFDLATDSWDTDPIRGGPNMSQAGGYRPLAVPVFRATGELVVLYNSSRSPERCSVVRLDVGSGLWSSPVELPVPRAALNHYTISAALGAGGDVHCLYAEEDGAYMHTVYSAGNTFGDPVDIADQTFWSSSSIPRYLSNLVYFTDGATAKLGFVRLEYNGETTGVDLYYSEGTVGAPWTWSDSLIVSGTNFWTGNPETYPGQFCSFSVFSGIKYAFWVEQDPHSIDVDDYLIWLMGTQNSGSGWSTPADATQRIAKSSTGVAKPHPTGCQTYSLDGSFSLLMAIGVATEEGYPEIWTYSGTPTSPTFAYFGIAGAIRTGAANYGFFV